MNASSSARTIYDQLASIEPSHLAVQDGDLHLNYGELRQKVDAFAAFLAAQNVRPGDRIATRLNKGVEEIICTYAAARLGAVFVNIHPAWPRSQVNQVLCDAAPVVLVGDTLRLAGLECDALIVNVDEENSANGAICFGDALATTSSPPRRFTDSTALASLLYTSGSTGNPKGVMHSHANLVGFATHVAEYLDNTQDDRIIGILPISFSYGLSQLLCAIRVGGTLVLPQSTIPGEIVATLERERITGVAGVALILSQIADIVEEESLELPQLRYITCAGGPLPDPIGRRLRKLLPDADLVLMYGSTEALRSTYLPASLYDSKPGAIGQAIPGVEVELITEDGRVAEPNEPGEIVHGGALGMLGYWRDEAASAAKLRDCPALNERGIHQPVLFTGDLARRDTDGCLWFVSRANWMIKSGGFRYSITELEQAIESLPMITTAVGAPHDDPLRGQIVELAVMLAEPGSHSKKTLLRRIKRELPGYMWPSTIHIIKGDLPVTANGKLDRPALFRKLAKDVLKDTDKELTQEEEA